MRRLRRRRLIRPGLQLRLVLVFASLACFASFFQVTLLHRSLLETSSKLTNDGYVLLEELPGILGWNLIVTLGVLVPLMLAVGVLTTHRIAGPVYRFEQHLGRIAAGEDPGECRIRRGDELHDLCAAINRAVGTLRAGRADEVPAEREGDEPARAA